MAVLLEAISVIVRRDAIDRSYPGGWDAFLDAVPNQTLCHDSDLCRVGFMNPADVEAYVAALQNHGLVFQKDGEAVDLSVVDQLRGPTAPTPWLDFGTIQSPAMKIAACWPTGDHPNNIALPPGWAFEGSISEQNSFVTTEEMDDRMKFLRREDDNDVYLDLRTGKDVYAGRPEVVDGGEAAVHNKLEKLFHQSLEIETTMQPLAGLGDTDSLAPHCRRLREDLLPRAQALADGDGNEVAISHFVVGLIHRILLDRKKAEVSFRKAYELDAGQLNNLRELVRCLGEQDRHQEALPFARAAVKHHPDDAGCWGNLAMCLIKCGERKDAEEALRQALLIDPADPINRTIRDNFDDYFKDDPKNDGTQPSS